MRRAAIAVSTIVLLQACSKPATPPASDAPRAQAAAASGQGRVTGRGPAPAPRGLAVVVLEPKEKRAFPPQDEKPVMDQTGRTFIPDLLFVRTGEPVEFRNSDDTLHNVRVAHQETRTSAFNVAIPTGETYSYTFTLDGFYIVGCDIHPEMSASIFASASPYTALEDADGRFEFAGVPAGAWTLTIYTGGRTLQKDVTVAGDAVDVTVP